MNRKRSFLPLGLCNQTKCGQLGKQHADLTGDEGPQLPVQSFSKCNKLQAIFSPIAKDSQPLWHIANRRVSVQ